MGIFQFHNSLLFICWTNRGSNTMLMTPQTRSVPIWALFIYPLPPPSHQNCIIRSPVLEPERSAIKIMNLLRYLHILPLSHSVITVIASLRDQKILTTESHSLYPIETLSVTPGYEVTQCSNALWFSLYFDCCANKYSLFRRYES